MILKDGRLASRCQCCGQLTCQASLALWLQSPSVEVTVDNVSAEQLATGRYSGFYCRTSYGFALPIGSLVQCGTDVPVSGLNGTFSLSRVQASSSNAVWRYVYPLGADVCNEANLSIEVEVNAVSFVHSYLRAAITYRERSFTSWGNGSFSCEPSGYTCDIANDRSEPKIIGSLSTSKLVGRVEKALFCSDFWTPGSGLVLPSIVVDVELLTPPPFDGTLEGCRGHCETKGCGIEPTGIASLTVGRLRLKDFSFAA